METYLVTGGAGFIGSNIVHALVKLGHRPRVLDNFATGRRENLAEVADAIDLVEGDVTDEAALKEACRGVDYVLHQAALPSVPRSLVEPLATHHANATGTLMLLIAARAAGVHRVIYAGSSSAYGDADTLPKLEDMAARPLSPYAVAKLAGEMYCRAFQRSYGFEAVVLRYFNVFGPRQNPESQYSAVIPRFIRAMLRGEPAVIHGDGTQTRDFTYIDNVVSANLLACKAAGAAGNVYNIASGARISLLDLHEALAEITESKLPPRFDEGRAGDVKHSLAGVDRARHVLGYEPRIGLSEGLRRTVDALRKA